jgi:site-specific recombinase XerD
MIGPVLATELKYFLADYLPRQQNASRLTILAYRDALKLLLQHIARGRNTSVDRLTFAEIDRTAVLHFLDAIECERHNAVTTRNARLTAIRAFFRSVASRHPCHLEASTQIRGIPTKRAESRVIDYLTLEEVNAILQSIDLTAAHGPRDDALIRFLHNTGARIQEALDALACDIRFEAPPHVRLHGKGRKERLCPLWPDTAARLRRLLDIRRVAPDARIPLFTNRAGRTLTRFGARYILAKYVRRAVGRAPTLAKKRIHPHAVRHATALHLLQSHVDLNTVRCWLGHASVVTTNRYVEMDLEAKRVALEGMNDPHENRAVPLIRDESLLRWLEGL